MPSRNRDTLKYYFSDGAMPSSEMFSDLIDSMLNMDEEGFRKSDVNGLELSNAGTSERLLSFYKQSQPDEPLWRVSLDGENNNLLISKVIPEEEASWDEYEADKAKYLLNLCTDGKQAKLGLGVAQPKDTLHVAGNVRAEGRRGGLDLSHEPAQTDGEWHTIAGPFVGCQALEVVARAKNDAKKRYGMIHAIAMHTISPSKIDFFSFLGWRNKIRKTHTFYDSWLHRLNVRWKPGKERGQYVLQLRSNCDYGKEGVIEYHVTNIWSDQDEDLQNKSGRG